MSLSKCSLFSLVNWRWRFPLGCLPCIWNLRWHDCCKWCDNLHVISFSKANWDSNINWHAFIHVFLYIFTNLNRTVVELKCWLIMGHHCFHRTAHNFTKVSMSLYSTNFHTHSIEYYISSLYDHLLHCVCTWQFLFIVKSSICFWFWLWNPDWCTVVLFNWDFSFQSQRYLAWVPLEESNTRAFRCFSFLHLRFDLFRLVSQVSLFSLIQSLVSGL